MELPKVTWGVVGDDTELARGAKWEEEREGELREGELVLREREPE